MKLYIKLIMIYIMRIVTFFFSILPLRKRHLLFISFLGKHYSCNPKYLYEYMKNDNFNNYKFSWVFINPEKYSYLNSNNTDIIKYKSFQYFIALMTYETIITNCDLPSWIYHRKKQQVVNTWHAGGAYKKVSMDYNLYPQSEIDRMASRNVTLYLSSCKKFSECEIKGGFSYNGEILECGLPRNDIFFNDYSFAIKKVRERYKINNKIKIALYAPTFRNETQAYEQIDFYRLNKILSERFSGEWIIFYRTHHSSSDTLENSNLVNVSEDDDMQELLCASDVLITDYSSSMWDFALTGRPCFLYAYDIDKYDMERGFYTDINGWPGILCRNNEELATSIINFNYDKFSAKIINHLNYMHSFEKGTACINTIKRIFNNAK